VICPQAVDTPLIAGVAVEDGGPAGLDGVISPEALTDSVIEGLAEQRFLILPHPQVEQYRQNKAASYDRWLGGMRKLRRRFIAG
jgi:hypothetical protein